MKKDVPNYFKLFRNPIKMNYKRKNAASGGLLNYRIKYFTKV